MYVSRTGSTEGRLFPGSRIATTATFIINNSNNEEMLVSGWRIITSSKVRGCCVHTVPNAINRLSKNKQLKGTS